MKNIVLRAEPPLYNYVDIRVMDRHDDGNLRQRCVVSCEFGQYDVEQLKKRGMSIGDALEYYKKWLYDVIRVNIADDWQCNDGYNEVIDIISQNVARFY